MVASDGSPPGDESWGLRTRSAHTELARLQSLLDDAAGSLCRSFHALHALHGRHAALTRRSVASEPEKVASAHELIEISGAVDREVTAMVTALQFQDMASQIIAHACRLLDAAPQEVATATPPVIAAGVEPGDVELF